MTKCETCGRKPTPENPISDRGKLLAKMLCDRCNKAINVKVAALTLLQDEEFCRKKGRIAYENRAKHDNSGIAWPAWENLPIFGKENWINLEKEAIKKAAAGTKGEQQRR